MSLDHADEFFRQIRERLKAGAREYGDASFQRPDAELHREIEEEILDIAGWSYVLWVKLRERLKRQERGL